jgi:hypothetical protein
VDTVLVLLLLAGLSGAAPAASSAEEPGKQCVLFGKTITGLCSGSRLPCEARKDCLRPETCRIGLKVCAMRGTGPLRSCTRDGDCPSDSPYNSCLLDGETGRCSASPEIQCAGNGTDVNEDGVGDDDCPKDLPQTCDTRCTVAYADCIGLGQVCEVPGPELTNPSSP